MMNRKRNHSPSGITKVEMIIVLVVAPLLGGGSDPVFDPTPFKGQYIYPTPQSSST